MPAVKNPTNQKAGNETKHFQEFHLTQNPAKGGIPLIATQPIKCSRCVGHFLS